MVRTAPSSRPRCSDLLRRSGSTWLRERILDTDTTTRPHRAVTLSLSSEVWGSRTEVSIRAGGPPPWRIFIRALGSVWSPTNIVITYKDKIYVLMTGEDVTYWDHKKSPRPSVVRLGEEI